MFRWSGLVPEPSCQVPQTREAVAKSTCTLCLAGLQWGSHDEEHLSNGNSWLPALSTPQYLPNEQIPSGRIARPYLASKTIQSINRWKYNPNTPIWSKFNQTIQNLSIWSYWCVVETTLRCIFKPWSKCLSLKNYLFKHQSQISNNRILKKKFIQ